MCKRAFEGRDDDEWSDEHARREAEENFTEAELEATEVVCDDCYRTVMPHLPRIRAELDQDAAALGMSYEELIRKEDAADRSIELFDLAPQARQDGGLFYGLFRDYIESNRCYTTASGMWVHVKPRCPHRRGVR